MKFRWNKGLIWVDIKLEYDGKKYNISDCIVDTGAATTAVDIDLIEFNYALPTQIKRLSGIGGTQEVVTQKVDFIRMCNIEISDFYMEFGNLQNNYGINGFIGTDILSKFRVDIDFLSQEIYLRNGYNKN